MYGCYINSPFYPVSLFHQLDIASRKISQTHFQCKLKFSSLTLTSTLEIVFKVPPLPACRYVEEKRLAAILATKRSAGVAPEVNFRKYVERMPLPSGTRLPHSGFETHRRCHQKSKTGVSVAPQKGLMSTFFKKNKHIEWSDIHIKYKEFSISLKLQINFNTIFQFCLKMFLYIL